jgi:hypothetical protein
MPAAVKNLIHETSSTTGTGNFTVAAVNGKVRFSDATYGFGTGGSNVFYYFISNRDAAEWEIGTGSMSATNTLVRDTVLGGSNGTSAVNFSAGTKDAVNDLPASMQDVYAATEKTTPVDADVIGLLDSAASYVLKKLTWANVKATISALFREKLTANRTYYVRTDGSDSNTGLVNNSGGAFLTIQKAIDVCFTLDLATYNVTIQIADGTYSGAVVVNGIWLGSGTVTIQGNSGTPANVLLSTGASNAITVSNGSLIVKDLKLTNSGNFLLYANINGYIEFSNLDFGACGAQQIRLSEGSRITATGNYTISGGGTMHWSAAANGAYLRVQSRTITLTGTPAFSASFANAQLGGGMIVNGNTFSGSATGSRYNASELGFINTVGAGTSYLPGNSAGTGTAPGAAPYGLYV